MQIIEVGINSEWLSQIRDLGDSQSATVGFLPEQAYNDYAESKHIYAALLDDKLAGYILFRITKNVTIIVHLCVCPIFQRKGIAKKLVNHLYENTKHTYGIKLNCRRDYNLEEFWRSLGFIPISEKTGKSKKYNTILTTWLKKHVHDDLFTYQEENNLDTRIIANLDTNIVIDLCYKADDESSALKAPYLSTLVKFKISNAVLLEINGQEDKNTRNKSREFAKQFDIVNEVKEQEFQRCLEVLKEDINCTTMSKNTQYDITHISSAITCGASAFITRDKEWLKSDVSNLIFEQFGLRILTPGQFILSLDELRGGDEYIPIRLMGLNLEYCQMRADDLNIVVDSLHDSSFEKQEQFRRRIRTLMTDPLHNTLLLIKSESRIVSLFGLGHTNNQLTVEIFRIAKNVLPKSLISTFIKRLAMKLIDKALQYECDCIIIKKELLKKEMIQPFLECGYIQNDDILYKIIVKLIASIPELQFKIKDIAAEHSLNITSAQQSQSSDLVKFEKLFFPCKVAEASIVNYIIPIRPSYAMNLFDENLSKTNISFFPNSNVEPALSIENAYYKSDRNVPQKYPARILWYISQDKKQNLIGTAHIRACSYLDSIEVENVKKVYNRYKRLGVLSWGQILNLCKGDIKCDIACLVFSFTELFNYPIPLQDLKKYYLDKTSKNINMQSRTEIDNNMFLDIYKTGTSGGRLNG